MSDFYVSMLTLFACACTLTGACVYLSTGRDVQGRFLSCDFIKEVYSKRKGRFRAALTVRRKERVKMQRDIFLGRIGE